MAGANRFRTLWITILGLLMLATLLGGLFMVTDRVSERKEFDFDLGNGRISVHIVSATMPREEWDTYFAQMREFAKANDLKIRIKRLKPDYDIFFVDLWRSDVLLLGGNVIDTPEFQTAFYIDPDKGGTIELSAALIESMKEFISQVPGITIRQTK